MDRRELLQKLASASLLPYSFESQKGIEQSRKLELLDGISEEGGITDVEGVRVGHFTDSRRPTGCTVVLCDDGALCGVHIPGGWPGTRLTDMLDPVRRADGAGGINAILLSGGSVYGLAAAGGVERYLKEIYLSKIPSPVPAKVFVVPAAVIYDLSVGDWTITPGEAAGYGACKAATAGKVSEGCIGAGAGARVGMMGGNPTKSGLGTASLRVGQTGIVIGALAVVNASGDVYHPRTGRPLAGSRAQDGRTLSPTLARMREGYRIEPPPAGTHTTLAVIATNVSLEKSELNKVAQMASAGLARTINPAWAMGDGDTVFALSTEKLKHQVQHATIGALAAEVLSHAIVRAVCNATPMAGLPTALEVISA